MITLSVDTTCKLCNVALLRDGRVIADHSFSSTENGESHSVLLLPIINNILHCQNIELKDIDLYSVSVGPGSFTGVRIGTSTVKGLAFPFSTPCIGVSSLAAMAEGFSETDGFVCPVINARRNQVYTAIFESRNGRVERLTEDVIITVTELEEELKKYGDVYFTGDAYDMVCHLSEKEAPASVRRASAVGAARLGERLYMADEDKSQYTHMKLLPVYLKKTQAEREREEKLELENKVNG